MSQIQEKLATLPDEKKRLFEPVFGSIDTFYEVIYLIAKNEHLTEQEKPARYEERLQVIRQMRQKAACLVSSFGLNGEEVVADIASDYFEDYAHYIDRTFDMQNEEYINYIKQLQLI